MILNRTLPIAVVFLFVASVHAAEDAKLSAALKQAQECSDATLEGDYEKLADMTHPNVVKLVGGKEKMVDLLKKSMAKMKDEGIIFESCKASAADSSLRSGTSLYCIIPTVVKIKFDDKSEKKRLTQQSFLLGVSTDDGKTWKFMDVRKASPACARSCPRSPRT